MKQRNIKKTKKYGGGGICYFSCMNYGTLGELYKIDGNLDGKQMAEIMNDSFLLSLDLMYENRSDALIVEDNDTKHKSGPVQAVV